MIKVESNTWKVIEPKQWRMLAAYLISIESSMSWGSTHASFSQWMSSFAKDAGKSEATLWRALAAGRYYNDIRTEAVKYGVQYPPLDDVNIKASPESLELFDKISRAAPAELVRTLQDKVMNGDISRSELRKIWVAYRPVLEGQTARGRNMEAPRFNPRNIRMIGLRLEADCVSALVQAGPTWLGADNAIVYKVISGLDSSSTRSTPDLIVLLKRDKRSSLELHGVEVTTTPERNGVLKNFKNNWMSVDFLWLALPTIPDGRQERAIPEGVGIIIGDQSGVQVLKQPISAKRDQVQTEMLYRELLVKICG